MRAQQRFTIYDAMDAKGVFDANSANAASRDPQTGQSLYAGPQPYPRMLYHPQGAQRIVAKAETIATPWGPKLANEHKELVSRTVANAVEEAKLLKEGWHLHPSDAIAAGMTDADRAAGLVAPPKSSAARIGTLEAERDRLLKELAELKAAKASGQIAVPADEDED
jgi:hypothetical protein